MKKQEEIANSKSENRVGDVPRGTSRLFKSQAYSINPMITEKFQNTSCLRGHPKGSTIAIILALPPFYFSLCG
jgi:hypothetical protein